MLSTEISPVIEDHERALFPGLLHTPQLLLQSQQNELGAGEPPSRATSAVVSETYLTAGANAVTVSDPPIVSESGRRPYALYSFDDRELFEALVPPAPPPRISFRNRMQSFIPRRELANLASWVHGRDQQRLGAESQLRQILDRQRRTSGADNYMGPGHEHSDLYR